MMSLRAGWLLAVCGLLGPLCAWGQDQPPPANEFAPRIITAETFAEWNHTTAKGLEMAEGRFLGKTRREIAALDRHCQLTDEQKEALREAGVAEFALWQLRTAQLGAKYIGRPLTFLENHKAQIEMSLVRNRLNAEAYHDQHGPFQQRAVDVLTLDQLPGYAEYLREQRKALLNRIWTSKASRSWSPVKFSPASREKLTALLLETAPPLLGNADYSHSVVFLQLNERKEQVRQILSDEEWMAFEEEALRAGHMEGYLREYKLWPNPQPADTATE
jgi:hypothetical protein